jgi:hypothetical protein
LAIDGIGREAATEAAGGVDNAAAVEACGNWVRNWNGLSMAEWAEIGRGLVMDFSE